MDLATAWRQALALAWDSYCAGTTPVGAVVVDAAGTVVARGRGRRFEPPTRDAQLAHSHIAHAEVNALALLPPLRHYEDHTLLTTLEPCCMCLGAAVQCSVTSLHYAAPDPYAGSAHLTIDTAQARRRPLHCTGPLPDERGAFAELLHVAWMLDVPVSKSVLQPHRDQRSAAYAHANDVRPQLHRLRADSATYEQAFTTLC